MEYEAREEGVIEDSFDRIGAELSAARLSRNIQINDLSQHLRISKQQLKSIEAGEFEALPGPTYAAGYLRSFAQEVGLDPVALTQRYRALLADEDKSQAYSFPIDTQRPQRSGAMLASIVVIFAVAGYGAWYAIGKPDVLTALTDDPQPEMAARPQIESTATEPDNLANRDVEPANLAETAAPSPQDVRIPNQPADAVVATAATAPSEPTDRIVTAPDTDLATASNSAVLPTSEAELALAPATETDSVMSVATGTSREMPAGAALPAIAAPQSAADNTADRDVADETMTTTLTTGMSDDRLATGTMASQEADNVVSGQIGTGVAFARQRVPDMEITLRATGASWVEIIRNNGEEVMAKLMRNGETYMIDSRDRLYLSTGNAGGLEILFSDGTTRSIGESGEILRDLLLDVDKLRNQF